MASGSRRCAIDASVVVTVVAAVVAALAAIAATVQLFAMRTAAHGELIHETMKMFRDPANRAARATVSTLEDKQLAEWSADDCRAAEYVAVQFSQLGFLIKNRYLSQRAFMDFWAARFCRMYAILEPYIEQQRGEWSSPDQWIYFEWLARHAFHHSRKHKPWWDRRSRERLQRATKDLRRPTTARTVDQQKISDRPQPDSQTETANKEIFHSPE